MSYSPDSLDVRLLLLRHNPEILDGALVEDLYEDLALVDATLVGVRDNMDPEDPKFARVYAAITGLRNAAKIPPNDDSLDVDDHVGAFEWREKSKAEAIKALKPSLALLDEVLASDASA